MLKRAPRRERPKVPRFLRRRRMMNELRGVTFDDSIRIVDAQLALIDQQSIRRRVTFKERDGAFDSPDAADE